MQIIYSIEMGGYVAMYEGRFGLSILAVDEDRVVAITKGAKRLIQRYETKK